VEKPDLRNQLKLTIQTQSHRSLEIGKEVPQKTTYSKYPWYELQVTYHTSMQTSLYPRCYSEYFL